MEVGGWEVEAHAGAWFDFSRISGHCCDAGHCNSTVYADNTPLDTSEPDHVLFSRERERSHSFVYRC